MRSLVPIPGSKAKLASIQANYLPQDLFTKSWETNAGTCAFTNNVLSGLGLEKMYATELETGMYNLLKVCKEEPNALIGKLLETEYSAGDFERAQEQEQDNYKNMTPLEIAVAKYVLVCQSVNGIGNGYRNIDKGCEEDFDCWIAAKKQRDRYKRQVFKLAAYSECLQDVALIQADFLDFFDKFASDQNMFIYSDIPYTNDLRAEGLYRVDTDMAWHKSYAGKLAKMTRDGRLKAKMMLCNYVSADLKNDVYCRELLKEGWTLYLIKDVFRPTVIRKKSKKQKKNKAVEVVFLNYRPVNPAVGKDRIFRYNDVFGKEVK